MSKSYYLHCKSRHSLPKFASKTQRIQVGNGQYVNILFVVPTLIEISGHRFETYMLVSEIHDNVDIVLGNKKLIRIEAPVTDEILSFAIVKLIDKLSQSVIMLMAKFSRNITMLDVTNSSSETLMLNPKEAIGILDLRSLGYYKIKQGVLQQNLSRYYKFELAEKMCIQFNNLINTLKKEHSLDMGEKYPQLDDSDERKYMSDREILEKYINLDSTHLTEEEKREFMDMLYRYKIAFSFRDEIGTCPNIEVGIDMRDKSPFLTGIFTLGKKIRK